MSATKQDTRSFMLYILTQALLISLAIGFIVNSMDFYAGVIGVIEGIVTFYYLKK
jgi:hypothetical protein